MTKNTDFRRKNKVDFGKEKIQILYEDEDIAIIYKPDGLLTVPYPGSRARTAIDALEQIMRKKGEFSKYHRPYVVHRLDRDTSGVMMFALNQKAQKVIMDNWQKMVTQRLYRAVGENPKKNFLPDEGVIDAPLAYNAHNIGFVPKEDAHPVNNSKTRKMASNKSENKMGTRQEKSIYERNLKIENGKPEFKTISARTNYKVIERGECFTLFELSLDTGRKNQIRAHLASKYYPLAGDENYRAKTNPFGRLALHARTLEFDHPFTKEHLCFEIPEPEDWIETVKNTKRTSDKKHVKNTSY